MSLKSVVITGASSGFGFALARRMDALGWRVFAGVRGDEDFAHVRRSLRPQSEPILLDVTNAAHVAAARDLVAERTGGRLDALVNNAGIVLHAPLEALTPEAFARQFEVNVFGVFAVTRAFLPLLRAASGRVVVIGSISGRVAWPFNGAYAASKHAVRALVESLRLEQRPFGVRATLIEPGAFRTEIWGKPTASADVDLGGLEPEVARRYDRALRIVDRAMRSIGTHAPLPDRCVDVIFRALTARSPRARYTVGSDVWAQLAFARLPAAVKDRVVTLAMNRALRPPRARNGRTT